MGAGREGGDDHPGESAPPRPAGPAACGAAVAASVTAQVGRLDQALQLNCRSHGHKPRNRPAYAA
jgi:hypothetical protein